MRAGAAAASSGKMLALLLPSVIHISFTINPVAFVANLVSLTARIAFLALIVGNLASAPLLAEPTLATEGVTARLAASESIPAQVASVNAGAKPAKPWALPKEHHPWARFSEGAWREIEVVTETFDEDGKLFGQSITTQKEVLKAVAQDSYVLDVQATVDVSGKRIAGPWNTRLLRLATDRMGAIFSTIRQSDKSLELNMGAINCQVWEVQSPEEGRNLLERLYYSPDAFPHVLRRDVIDHSENSAVESPALDTTMVTARFIPFPWEGRIIECVEQQTIRRREKGDSQTVALLSREVPGGEVQSQSTDFDPAGRRIRWSIQKLIGFGVSSPENAVAEPAISQISGERKQK
jgi:hypothetical protein